MILAFETSTRHASLAVFDIERGEVAREASFTTDRAHNAVIFGPVQALVEEFRTRLSGLVVGLGPGSYGGVRVGLAVANGLSIALGLPVAGFSSLEAWDVEGDSYRVAGDARRGSFFLAEIRGRRLRGEPELFEAGVLAETLEKRRDGLPLCTPDPGVVRLFPEAVLSHPTATRLAALVGPGCFERTETNLEPHYLRAPYITTPKAR